MASDLPRLSAIVVAHRRPRPTALCIESLLAQTERELEVIVVLNDPTPLVEAVVHDRTGSDPRVRIICTKTSASEARNHAVAIAKAPILYFVDDDVSVPERTVETLLAVFQSAPEFSAVGGPNLTPPDDPEFAQITGEVLASPWGTGVASPRYARRAPRRASERHLILCNLAVHRRVFEQGIRFPLHFGGEENVILGRASQRGFALWYSPDVWVYHRRRYSLRAYAVQLVRYGRGRALALRAAPGTFHVAYFVPVAFGLYLAALPIFGFWGFWAYTPLLAYFGGTLLSSLLIAVRRRRAQWVLLLPGLFVLTHLAYAYGLVTGLIRTPRGHAAAPDPPSATSPLS
ncbi:MAG TPA: glycosyltransferase [Polyangiaceae bacterium]|nr:glycosyltransferase [Polyangiaceae bacterium]